MEFIWSRYPLPLKNEIHYWYYMECIWTLAPRKWDSLLILYGIYFKPYPLKKRFITDTIWNLFEALPLKKRDLSLILYRYGIYLKPYPLAECDGDITEVRLLLHLRVKLPHDSLTDSGGAVHMSWRRHHDWRRPLVWQHGVAFLLLHRFICEYTLTFNLLKNRGLLLIKINHPMNFLSLNDK